MKITIVCIYLLSTFVSSFSQEQKLDDSLLIEKPKPVFISGMYFGPSIGSNNVAGIVGLLTEVRIYRNFTLAGGLGIALWGPKVSLQARYYKNYPLNFYYGLGYSFISGFDEVEQNLYIESVKDPQKVKLEYLDVKVITISIGDQLRLGRRTRLSFELGYAIPMQTEFYEIKSPGVALTKDSENILYKEAPGGFILGITFSLGLY
jgi:hypothetical protein